MRILLTLLCTHFISFLFGRATTDSMYVTTSDSVQLFVKISGQGIPVLFIHGGPGSNAAYFEYEGGNVFEKDAMMIYMDQRGCGRSGSATNKDYSLSRLVKDFEEVRQALKIENWLIMPHSFGGILGNQYALQYPGSVKGIIMLNATLHINASATSGIIKTIDILNDKLTQQEKKYLLTDSVPVLSRWFHAFWHLSRFGLKHTLMFDKKESADLDSIITSSHAKNYEFANAVWQYPEYFEDHSINTAEIKMPVLIISGTRDYTIGINHPELMHYPVQQIKYIEGGHALYLERNKELYEAVIPFIRQF